jgi:hypothetical protein
MQSEECRVMHAPVSNGLPILVMQQETRNCIGNCQTVEAPIESLPDQNDWDA